MKPISLIICILGLIMIPLCSWADEIDDLIPAIIQVESGGRANAVSPCGAIGLMQITPICMEEINKAYNCNIHLTDLKDPIVNKYVGMLYLRRLKDYYGCNTIEKILMAYNWGIGNCKRHHFCLYTAPKETRNYVKKVMKIYSKN